MNDKPKPKGAKKDTKKSRPVIHLGMMGDGTEEQNLGERVMPRSVSRKTRWMGLSTSQPKEQTLTSEFDDEIGAVDARLTGRLKPRISAGRRIQPA